MIQKDVRFFGKVVTLTCDGRCDKAWGINSRRKKFFVPEKEDLDDFVYLGDDELGKARLPMTSEDSDMRPSNAPVTDGQVMNKWCARECERCRMQDPDTLLMIPNMKTPVPNKPRRHPRLQEIERIRNVIFACYRKDATESERDFLLARHLFANPEDWPDLVDNTMSREDQSKFATWFQSLTPGTTIVLGPAGDFDYFHT